MKEFPKTIEIEIKNYPKETPELIKTFKELGLQKFDSLAFQFKNIPEGTYNIETDFLFSNQYNTVEGLRIFEKSSCLSMGGKTQIKLNGYYISKGIEKVREIQKRQKVCGYCGKRYNDSNQIFCNKCLGSEYLEEKYLKLLRLYPVYPDMQFQFPELTESEKAELLPAYVSEQTKSLKIRNVEKLNRLREKYDKTLKSAQDEYNGFMWLMDHDINTENCIYYEHTGIFCFGWRKPIGDSVKTELQNKLKEFPYRHEFK